MMSVQMTSDKLVEVFNNMRENEAYLEMGDFFWMAFVSFDETDKRCKVVDDLWDSLTKEEQEMCEG